jgi:hypothetical protein
MRLVDRKFEERQPRTDVRVTAGVLEGLEGQLVATEADQVVVSLGPGVYIVVSRGNVEPLSAQATNGRSEPLRVGQEIKRNASV